MKQRVSRVLMTMLCVGCATNPPAEPEEAYVRLLEVEPEVGTRLAPGATIHVRAAYRLASDANGHHASLMFLTERGSLVSTADARAVDLTEPEGVIELTAMPNASFGPLAEPLTAVVMVLGPPGEPSAPDTIEGAGDMTPEMRARLDQLRDSMTGSGRDSTRVLVRRRSVPRVMRSRAIFYNGAGPARAIRGPVSFDEVIAEYRTYRGHKAFALAVDRRGQRTWGYGFGFAVTDSAIARAMRECEQSVVRRSLDSTCQLYAVNDSIFQDR